MNDEEFFPKEKNKKNHSCEIVAIVFIILFFIGAFFIWKIYQRLYSSHDEVKVEFSNADLESFNNKFNNINQNNSIEITQEELSAYLNSSFSSNNFAIKNPYATINPKGITIYADVWPNGQTQITILPQIIDNHLKLNLVNSNLPSTLVNPILEKISTDLEQKITQNKVKLTDLELEEGKMIIKISPPSS